MNHISKPQTSEDEADDPSISLIGVDAQVDLATSSYHQCRLIIASHRVPVRVTHGHPRFRLGYDIEATIKEIAPTKGLLAIQDPSEFDIAYRDQLDLYGVIRIGQRLSAVSEQSGQRGLVLLCFEDIGRLGEFSCHRRAFARWWEARTGEEVPELV